MIYAGMNDQALKVIQNVRNRYDGQKRSPFDEEECGHHYARAMAAWSNILALSEFNYSAVDQKLSVTAKPGVYFWSTGYAWGQFTISPTNMFLTVHHGTLNLKSVELKDGLKVKVPKALTLTPNSDVVKFDFLQK
jgi:hypothetical protein